MQSSTDALTSPLLRAGCAGLLIAVGCGVGHPPLDLDEQVVAAAGTGAPVPEVGVATAPLTIEPYDLAICFSDGDCEPEQVCDRSHCPYSACPWLSDHVSPDGNEALLIAWCDIYCSGECIDAECRPGEFEAVDECGNVCHCTPDGRWTCTQFPCKGECTSDADCVITGCSGQLCEPQPVYTTCEFDPGYACYGDPQVTRCGCHESRCGWARTDALDACLARGSSVELDIGIDLGAISCSEGGYGTQVCPAASGTLY